MSPSVRPVHSGQKQTSATFLKLRDCLWSTGRTVLGVLLLSGVTSCLHHYVYIAETKTRQEARLFCRERYADLASVDNMEDVERLVAAAAGREGEAWIGTYDKHLRWFWSADSDSIKTTNRENFQRWGPGQPHLRRSLKHLCVVWTDGIWKDALCDARLPFVCCNNSFPDISIQRYLYLSDEKTWDEARAHCRLHHAALTSVRDETENLMIQDLVPEGQRAWIGLHRHPFSHRSDKTRSTFGNWIPGHPEVGTGNCVTSRFGPADSGLWRERHCRDRVHFMCNIRQRLFILKLKVLKSTIDLNDPDVTDAILDLIKEGMKNKGITGGFKVAWIKDPDENVFHKEEEI